MIPGTTSDIDLSSFEGLRADEELTKSFESCNMAAANKDRDEFCRANCTGVFTEYFTCAGATTVTFEDDPCGALGITAGPAFFI